MRKTLMGILCIALISAAGCQATPEQPIVVQKDMQQMLEEAKKDDTQTPENRSLREQYDVPEEYQFAMQGADGKLHVSADARIIVPDSTAMHIYRVKAVDFTQEQATAFFEYFCGDAEMWQTPEQQTKSEVEQSIVSWRKFMKDEGEEDNPKALATLADLEKALETAPEKIEEQRCYGELETLNLYKDPVNKTEKIASYTGFRSYEKGDDGKIFVVQNNSDLTEAVFVPTSDSGGYGFSVDRMAYMSYRDYGNPAASVNFGYSASVPIFDDNDIDEALLDKIGLKPSEARQMVQDVLVKTGTDLMIDSVYFMDDEQKGYVDDEVRPAKNYAYKIFCVRKVEGLPCAAIEGRSQVNSDSGAGDTQAMAGSWGYEYVEFMVNAGGVFSMTWQAPLEVLDVINDNTRLKPFFEIQEIFEKMMRIKYEADPTLAHGGVDFEISRVTLSLQRITEQNSIENGLLVPTWNFYGKRIEHYEDGGENEEIGASFMSINAIDGSIINTEKGY